MRSFIVKNCIRRKHTNSEKKCCTLQEIGTFAKYVIRKFFEVAESNPKVFMELFFWKTMKDAMEITEGYGTTIAKLVFRASLH